MAKIISGDIREYLNYDSDVEEGAVFAVPNELITDFKDTHKIGKCAYAYSYYYLQMYLHLYAKYGTENTIDKFTFKGIQKILGVSPDSRAMNSLTKKGGELDQLGYTSTVTDYPVNLMRIEKVDGSMEVNHYMYSEEKRDFPNKFTHSSNFTVKHPDKMYWRTPEYKEIDYYNGTMNEADSTHIIPLEMFFHSLNLGEIMTKGFYVYGYIIYMSDKANRRKEERRKRNRGWTVTPEYFSKFLGVSTSTLRKILKKLEQHGFIEIKRNQNAKGIDLPNTYIPNLDPKKVVY